MGRIENYLANHPRLTLAGLAGICLLGLGTWTLKDNPSSDSKTNHPNISAPEISFSEYKPDFKIDPNLKDIRHQRIDQKVGEELHKILKLKNQFDEPLSVFLKYQFNNPGTNGKKSLDLLITPLGVQIPPHSEYPFHLTADPYQNLGLKTHTIKVFYTTKGRIYPVDEELEQMPHYTIILDVLVKKE